MSVTIWAYLKQIKDESTFLLLRRRDKKNQRMEYISKSILNALISLIFAVNE